MGWGGDKGWAGEEESKDGLGGGVKDRLGGRFTYLALRDSMNPVPAHSTALRWVKVSNVSFPWYAPMPL